MGRGHGGFEIVLIQRGDVVEDVIELRGVGRGLAVAQPESRQFCDVMDVDVMLRHGAPMERRARQSQAGCGGECARDRRRGAIIGRSCQKRKSQAPAPATRQVLVRNIAACISERARRCRAWAWVRRCWTPKPLPRPDAVGEASAVMTASPRPAVRRPRSRPRAGAPPFSIHRRAGARAWFRQRALGGSCRGLADALVGGHGDVELGVGCRRRRE